jgi:hypothetical protein
MFVLRDLQLCNFYLILILSPLHQKSGVHVAFLRHWSYAPNDKKVWFAVYSTDGLEASSIVNDIFDNTGNVAALPIEIRPLQKSATFHRWKPLFWPIFTIQII